MPAGFATSTRVVISKVRQGPGRGANSLTCDGAAADGGAAAAGAAGGGGTAAGACAGAEPWARANLESPQAATGKPAADFRKARRFIRTHSSAGDARSARGPR